LPVISRKGRATRITLDVPPFRHWERFPTNISRPSTHLSALTLTPPHQAGPAICHCSAVPFVEPVQYLSTTPSACASPTSPDADVNKIPSSVTPTGYGDSSLERALRVVRLEGVASENEDGTELSSPDCDAPGKRKALPFESNATRLIATIGQEPRVAISFPAATSISTWEYA
jgi:hypothetical protein